MNNMGGAISHDHNCCHKLIIHHNFCGGQTKSKIKYSNILWWHMATTEYSLGSHNEPVMLL